MSEADTVLKEHATNTILKSPILETFNHQQINSESLSDVCKENDVNVDNKLKVRTSEDNVITNAIVVEEKKLHEQNEEESAKIDEEAMEQWKHITEDVRLTQLNHLLEKSSIYANYLLDVIENCKKKEKKRALRKQKKHFNPKVNDRSDSSKSEKKLTRVRNKKRKAEQSAENSSKHRKKCDVVTESSGDASSLSCVQPVSNFSVGDKIEVIKIDQNNEENLSKAKIIDKRYVRNEWKYQVHYFGFKKTDDEWIVKSAIANDIVDKDNSDDEKESEAKAFTKLQSSINRVNKEDLLQAKLHVGTNNIPSVICNGVQCFNGLAVPDSQPVLFTGGVLRDYQVTGFEWLKILFNNAVNGILADEMGLGKTIQCIAMICWLIKSGFQGPFLVCAPLSTICNWINEFKKFSPQVPLLLYHGSPAERAILSKSVGKKCSTLNCCPVVVTSYEVLMRDRLELAKSSWDYLIVDEGHRIKNMNCRLVKELKLLKVTAKVLLTGTPLQNNLRELWSLLNFLLPEVFNDLSTFEAWFDFGKIQQSTKTFSSAKEENVVVMLHKILAPFLLRRTKDDSDISLPPKRELIIFAPLSENQREKYQAIANRTIRKLLGKETRGNCEENEINLAVVCNENSKNGFQRETRSSTLPKRLSKAKEDSKNIESDSVINISLNNLMVQLRKCCNHPYLIQYPLIPGTDFYKIDNDVINSSGKMQLLDKMLRDLKAAGHKVLLFSQMTKMLDIIQDYCNFKNYNFLRFDGSTRYELRQKSIEQFNNDLDVFLFLLSTRAGGVGINLTAADTVIIYDSDWNPQNDLQAQDRCHRIGQTRPVVVYRLVSANTVDQFMVERAEAKRVLERMIINRSKFKGQLAEDLNSTKSNTVVSTTLLAMLQKSAADGCHNQPISDVDLKIILNRKVIMDAEEGDLPQGVLQSNA